MDSTIERARRSMRGWSAYVPVGAIVALLAGALIVGLRFGAPAVVLWFAFAALAGAILLFWESLRTALGSDLGSESDDSGEVAALSDLEERKLAALRALKDIEFEHSIQRISDADYEALRKKYRAEARAAMEALDRGLGPYLARAEELIAHAADAPEAAPRNKKKARRAAAAAEPVSTVDVVPPVAAAERAICPSCTAANDVDAVFCKKCGARIAAEG